MFFLTQMASLGDITSYSEAGLLDLIAGIQAGKRSAEDGFTLWILERITPVIRRKVGASNDDWKDVRQKGCLEILKSIKEGKYDPQKAPVGAFISGIVRHVLGSYFRTKARQEIKMSVVDFTDPAQIFGERIADIAETIDGAEKKRHEHLRRCLEQLPESQRIAVIYSFYEDEKHQQIGLRLNKNPQQVAELKRLAKVRLKKCMERFYPA